MGYRATVFNEEKEGVVEGSDVPEGAPGLAAASAAAAVSA